MSESSPLADPSRRNVLDVLLKLGVLGWLGSVMYPIIRYLAPLPMSGPTGPVALTRAEEEKVERDKFAIVQVGNRRLLVLEDSEGELHALDAKCTHEGCTVRFLPREDLIACACHNARFDLQGRVLAGPPPRPLPRYFVQRDSDGDIVVALKTA